MKWRCQKVFIKALTAVLAAAWLASAPLGSPGAAEVPTSETRAAYVDKASWDRVVMSGGKWYKANADGTANTAQEVSAANVVIGMASVPIQNGLPVGTLPDRHYFSINADDSASPAGTNYNNDGATGTDAVAAGRMAKAEGASSVAFGPDSHAAGEGAISIGRMNPGQDYRYQGALGNDSVAIGTDAIAGVKDHPEVSASVALGIRAVSTKTDAVALGSYSMADRGPVTDSSSVYMGSNRGVRDTAENTRSAVAVGRTTGGQETWATPFNRQITGVAAGTENTDAVNVAQLKAVAEAAGAVSADDMYFHVNPGAAVDPVTTNKGSVTATAGAGGASSLAAGTDSWVAKDAKEGVAVGHKVEIIRGKYGTAMGDNIQIDGRDSNVAIGKDISTNVGAAGVFVGSELSVTGAGTGGGNDTIGANSLIGYRNTMVEGSTSVMIGSDNSLKGGEPENANMNVILGKYNDINKEAGNSDLWAKHSTVIGVRNTVTNPDRSLILGEKNIVKGTGLETVDGKQRSKLADSVLLGNSNDITDTRVVSVIGGGNTVSNSRWSSVTGVGNKVLNAEASNVIGNCNSIFNSKQNNIIGSNNALPGSSSQNFVAGSDNTLGAYLVGNQILSSGGTVADNVTNGVLIGQGGSLTASNAVAIGTNAKAKDDDSIAVGSGAQAGTGDAPGPNGENFAIAVGYQSKALYRDGVSIGQMTESGISGTSVGSRSKSGEQGTSLGFFAESGVYGTAVGANAKAGSVDNGTALGADAKVTVNDGVALGYDSAADRAAFTTDTTAPFSKAVLSADNTLGAVSVGGNGKLRQIVNVGDGTEDTDAVNVRQLQAVADMAGAASADMYFHVNPGAGVAPVGTNKGPMTATAGAGGANSLAAGINAKTGKDAEKSVAIGYGSYAKEVGAVSIGSGAGGEYGAGISIGDGSVSQRSTSLAIGTGAKTGHGNGPTAGGGDIAVGDQSFVENYVNQGGGIAIGQKSHVENMYGSRESLFAFGQTDYSGGTPADPSKVATGIAIGQNSFARTGSLMVGTHNYRGLLGDVTVDSANTRELNLDINSTTLGTNSYNEGAFSTVTGAYSIASGNYSTGRAKNFGANIYGALNSIESETAASPLSGVANSVVGTANRTFNSNGSLVFGAGNEIKNSVAVITGMPTSGGDSAKALADSIRTAVKSSDGGGATLAIGGGNTADYTRASQLTGVNNTLTGTASQLSEYNLLDGYKNTGENVSRTTIIGSENTAKNGESNVIVGDRRTMDGRSNNVVMGSSDGATETAASDAVIVGHNANAQIDGGVALGSGSTSDRATTAAGVYVPSNADGSSIEATAKGGYGVVSVGNGSNTRQIAGVAAGIEDTDAVNVAQLRVLDEQVVKYDDATKKTVTLGGAGGTTIKNVAAGAAGTDAVNVSQLNKVASADMYFHTNPGAAVDPVASNKGPMTATAGAGGANSVAAGVNATTSKSAANSVAVGYKAAVNGSNSVAVGTNNTADLGTTTVIGSYSSATGTLSGAGGVAMMGYQNILKDASRVVMLGSQNKLTGNATSNEANKSVLIGAGNTVNQNAGNTVQYFKHTTLIGTDNTNVENPENSLILGNRNTVKGTGTESVLFRTRSKLADSILLGESNSMTDTRRVSVIGGTNTAANSYNSSVTGISNKLTNASASSIIGIRNTISMDVSPSTFLGDATNDVQDNIIGVGNSILNASKQNSVIGSNNTLSGSSTQNFVAGFGNNLGESISGNQILSSGGTVAAGVTDGVLIGRAGRLTASNAVALGSSSAADRAAFTTDTTAPFSKAVLSADNTLGAVSVGGNGKLRQIVNVGDGTEATDAVNLRQLQAVADMAGAASADMYFHTNPGAATNPVATNKGPMTATAGAGGANSLAAGINAKTTREAEKAVAIGYGSSSDGAGSIAVGDTAKVESNGYPLTSIAVGKKAYVLNGTGQQEYEFSFDKSNWTVGGSWLHPTYTPHDTSRIAGGIAVGTNSYARTGSIQIGSHTFTGAMGGIDVTSATNGEANIVNMTTIGSNSYNKAVFGTMVGAYSIATGDFDGSGGFNSLLYGSQNFGANVVGSLNSVRSKGHSGSSGVANSIVGVANMAENANGALIFGAGNNITNSIVSLSAPSAVDTVDEMTEELRRMIQEKEGGGAVLAVGGGNTADYAQASQLMGVNNTLTGTSGSISKYNLIDGYKNTGENVSHVTIIGSENSVKNGESNVIVGDRHMMDGRSNNVVMGSADGATETTASDAVIVGHNANVVSADSAVALGSSSTADRAGFTVATPAPFSAVDLNGQTWGAVSVGGGGQLRQIINLADGTEDTDAVNLRQLRGGLSFGVRSGGGSVGSLNMSSAVTAPIFEAGAGLKAEISGTNTIVFSVDTSSDIYANLKGEKGDKGDPGADGRGVTKAEVNSAGDLVVSYTDGADENAG
ncbi:hypothetical protein, partial [Synergistes jonesii]